MQCFMVRGVNDASGEDSGSYGIYIYIHIYIYMYVQPPFCLLQDVRKQQPLYMQARPLFICLLGLLGWLVSTQHLSVSRSLFLAVCIHICIHTCIHAHMQLYNYR